eukprot:2952882-Rhodomonas_salina.1
MTRLPDHASRHGRHQRAPGQSNLKPARISLPSSQVSSYVPCVRAHTYQDSNPPHFLLSSYHTYVYRHTRTVPNKCVWCYQPLAFVLSQPAVPGSVLASHTSDAYAYAMRCTDVGYAADR